MTDARDGRRGRAALLAVLCASWASAATPGGEAPAASAAIDGGANDDGANDDGAHDDEGAPGRRTVVFGHRDRSEPSADPAAASSVVTLDRAPRSGETVADLLAELPGVAINRLGGLGSMALMSVRGSTWEQVRVLVDGVPLSSANGGGVDLSTIPVGDVERIEVYRGSSPLSLGASALGGIVSITTRTPRASAAWAQGGLGSFGATQAGVSGSLAGPLGVYVGAAWESAQNDFPYFSNHGTAFDTRDDGVLTRQNAAYRQLSGTARVVWRLPGHRELTAGVSAFDRSQAPRLRAVPDDPCLAGHPADPRLGFLPSQTLFDVVGQQVLLTDAAASAPRLRVFDVTSATPTEEAAVDPSPSTGLPPRYLGWY